MDCQQQLYDNSMLQACKASNSSKTTSCDYHELKVTAAEELLHIFFMNHSSSSSMSICITTAWHVVELPVTAADHLHDVT
jgi:hypothetical protein